MTRFSSLIRRLAALFEQRSSLRELDERTLADIGVDRSEIASIEAESRGQAGATRLRLAVIAHGA